MTQVLKQNGLSAEAILNGAADAVGRLAVSSHAVPKEIAADFAKFGNLFKLRGEDFAPALVSNQTVQVDLRVRDSKGAGVGSLQLMEMHTRRLHVLAIDPSLEDYHHEHPITSGRPGDFVFVMTPKRGGNYLMWLDVTPLATGRNEAPQAVIGNGPVLAGPMLV